MKTAIAFWNIMLKDFRNYYLKPPNISWGIIFPFAWMLMFFLKSQTPVDVRTILPGIMAMSILFGTTSLLSVTITFERRSRSFDRLLLAPISLTWLMLAKTLGAILFGIVNAFIPVLIAMFFIPVSNINWAILVLSVIFIAVTSTFLGLFIAVSVSEVFEAQTFSNFFRFPMVFLCGLFIPITQLPVFLRPISYLVPLTYGADLLKTAINQNGHIKLGISLLVLLAFSIILFLISKRNIQHRWIY
ncbi:ABC transporter permease [candidate division KSB1 bacterium]|nr:ABC transporter permease [candidate division KSB1 bacterium]